MPIIRAWVILEVDGYPADEGAAMTPRQATTAVNRVLGRHGLGDVRSVRSRLGDEGVETRIETRGWHTAAHRARMRELTAEISGVRATRQDGMLVVVAWL